MNSLVTVFLPVKFNGIVASVKGTQKGCLQTAKGTIMNKACLALYLFPLPRLLIIALVFDQYHAVFLRGALCTDIA